MQNWTKSMLQDMAKANAQSAYDERESADYAEGSIAAYRKNVIDTLLDCGQDAPAQINFALMVYEQSIFSLFDYAAVL